MAFILARGNGRSASVTNDTEKCYRLNNNCDFCGTKCLRKLCPPCRDRVATKSLLGQEALTGVKAQIVNVERNVVIMTIKDLEYGMGYAWPVSSAMGFNVVLTRHLFGGKIISASRNVEGSGVSAEVMYSILMDLEKSRLEFEIGGKEQEKAIQSLSFSAGYPFMNGTKSRINVRPKPKLYHRLTGGLFDF